MCEKEMKNERISHDEAFLDFFFTTYFVSVVARIRSREADSPLIVVGVDTLSCLEGCIAIGAWD